MHMQLISSIFLDKGLPGDCSPRLSSTGRLDYPRDVTRVFVLSDSTTNGTSRSTFLVESVGTYLCMKWSELSAFVMNPHVSLPLKGS
jgi:hypothetical protein